LFDIVWSAARAEVGVDRFFDFESGQFLSALDFVLADVKR
jgi:hypothetical protein